MASRVEPVDAAVGGRIRAYRLAQGMSQAELGREVGVTFQQIQKYEKGVNRVGSSWLKQFATIFEVEIDRKSTRLNSSH